MAIVKYTIGSLKISSLVALSQWPAFLDELSPFQLLLLKNAISRGAGVLPEVRKVDWGTSSSAVISLGFLVAVLRLSEARAKLGSKIFPFDKFLWLIFLRQGDGRFHVGVWVIVFMCCFGDAKALDGVSFALLDRARYVGTRSFSLLGSFRQQ